MYNIIPPTGTSEGTINVSSYRYVMQNMATEIQKVIDYRLLNPRAVRSDHPIAKLVNNLPVNLEMEDIVYVDRISDLSDKYAQRLNFTTINQYGGLHSNVFYGDGVGEIIISVQTPFDVDADWRQLEPIRVISHPQTSLNIEELTGTRTEFTPGFAVIAVDIPKLAFMYRKWRELYTDIENKENIQQFVASYPTLNALKHHLDIAVLNRIGHMYHGRTPTFYSGGFPFKVVDYHDRLDDGIDQLITRLNRRSMTVRELLDTIPLPSGETALQAVTRYPDFLPLRQITWAFNFAQLKLVHFLLVYDRNKGGSKNRDYLNAVRGSLKRIRNDRTMLRVPEAIYEWYADSVSYELEPYL